MRGLFDRKLTPAEIYDFSIDKETIYQQLIINDLQFAPGAEDLFDYLKSKAIPFTIATSADIFNVDFYYREMKLERWFDRQKVVYNDGTLKGKPEPDIFLRAASRLELQPADLIVFEDSKAGIKAAERAGAGKIYIVDSAGDPDLKLLGHELITHFDQMNRSIIGF